MKKIGRQTVAFTHPPVIYTAAAVAGKKEAQGPLGRAFDYVQEKGEGSWEQQESALTARAARMALEKASTAPEEVDYLFGGDLLNQCAGTVFGIRDLPIPFFGLFGACATFGEAMSLGAMMIDGGYARQTLCLAGSHFCSAEKQFRFPLGMGTQRPPTTTWTVTGCGAVLLRNEGPGPRITHVTTGMVVDYGVRDAAHMGAAMAPAAAQAISAHLRETGRNLTDYTWIVTGDLGEVGRSLVCRLLEEEGFYPDSRLTDCGLLLFDNHAQDTHSGGSGCACSAITYGAYFHPRLQTGGHRLLLVPTGALMNLTVSQQGESIPGIAYAVAIEGGM
ncbi:MAG TPA: stage V sporulation protein AD [Firmicutes bacterium]|nr:stage V sporulation protein AD [Bacillota bacterium]